MESEELVSIIVPMFNCEKMISDLIICLKKQTYKIYEVFLIDDGSEDNTLKACKDVIGLDVRFKLISKENAGVSSARNLGLKLSIGKYIAFIDADDIINDCYLEELVKNMKSANLSISVMKAVKDEQESVIYNGYDDNISAREFLLNHWSVCGRLFFKKDLVNIYFDEKINIAEDLKFTVNYLCSLIPICTFSSKAVYYYRVGKVSAMCSEYSKKFLVGLLAEVECYKEMLQYSVYTYNSQIIGNGAYQLFTRYFEQGRKLRIKYENDYKIAKKIVRKYKKIILLGSIQFKKKLFIILACYCPATIVFYKKYKKSRQYEG